MSEAKRPAPPKPPEPRLVKDDNAPLLILALCFILFMVIYEKIT